MMQKAKPAASPDAYVAALRGWRRDMVEALRAIAPALKPGGRYEMATIAFGKGMAIDAANARRLAREAVIAVAPDVFRVGPCCSTLVSGLPVEYTYQVHSIRDPASGD